MDRRKIQLQNLAQRARTDCESERERRELERDGGAKCELFLWKKADLLEKIV